MLNKQQCHRQIKFLNSLGALIISEPIGYSITLMADDDYIDNCEWTVKNQQELQQILTEISNFPAD